jgi:hypothetical protein
MKPEVMCGLQVGNLQEVYPDVYTKSIDHEDARARFVFISVNIPHRRLGELLLFVSGTGITFRTA